MLLCRELGWVRFGHWAIDGSRIKANASKNAMRRRESIQAELAALREQIRQVLAEAEAADVCTDQTDYAQLIPQLDQAQSALGQPAELSADTGYATGPNLAAVADRGITGYIPPQLATIRPEVVFRRTDFRYEP